MTEELWKCDVEDFARACHFMQLLRHAIMSEMNPDGHGHGHCHGASSSSESSVRPRHRPHNHSSNRYLPFQVKVLFDPGEIFLCIQRTVLRFHAKWQQRREEFTVKLKRKQAQKRSKRQRQRQRQHEDEGVDADIDIDITEDVFDETKLDQVDVNVNNDNEDDVDTEEETLNFKDEEKLAWLLWEAAMFAITALARECVGPAWKWQLYQRRNEAAMKKYLQKYKKRNRTRQLSNTEDSISTIGMRSTTSTTIPFTLQSQSPNENVSCISSGEEDWGFNPSTSPSPSTSSLQSVVGPAELAAESALAFFAGSQNQNSLQINLNLSEPQSRSRSRSSSSGLPIIDYPPIPEVLPSAMLRFAASVCTTVLEPVKTMDSIVSIRPVYEDIITIVRSEQRKLLRRQRIGEAQRDLILALCYGDRKEKNDPENNNHKVESDSWQTSTQWSIVGAHIPIATMFVSWAETAISGWPMEKSQDTICNQCHLIDDGTE